MRRELTIARQSIRLFLIDQTEWLVVWFKFGTRHSYSATDKSFRPPFVDPVFPSAFYADGLHLVLVLLKQAVRLNLSCQRVGVGVQVVRGVRTRRRRTCSQIFLALQSSGRSWRPEKLKRCLTELRFTWLEDQLGWSLARISFFQPIFVVQSFLHRPISFFANWCRLICAKALESFEHFWQHSFFKKNSEFI